MRIGAKPSRRTGVTPELLRAWEQRYQLLRPSRSSGGFRLYSSADEARVRRTTALIAEGLSAAEAAGLAATDELGDQLGERPLVADLAGRLEQALDGFDAAAAQDTLDHLFAAVSLEFALTDVLIPYLRDLGERWAAGTATVAQEHFASNLILAPLLGLAQGWGADGSSTSVAACLPGEAHDPGLVMLSLLMARRGMAGHLPRSGQDPSTASSPPSGRCGLQWSSWPPMTPPSSTRTRTRSPASPPQPGSRCRLLSRTRPSGTRVPRPWAVTSQRPPRHWSPGRRITPACHESRSVHHARASGSRVERCEPTGPARPPRVARPLGSRLDTLGYAVLEDDRARSRKPSEPAAGRPPHRDPENIAHGLGHNCPNEPQREEEGLASLCRVGRERMPGSLGAAEGT